MGISEKIADIEKEMSRTQKNKATESVHPQQLELPLREAMVLWWSYELTPDLYFSDITLDCSRPSWRVTGTSCSSPRRRDPRGRDSTSRRTAGVECEQNHG